MLKDFEVADPNSEYHWKKKADLAFRFEIVKYFELTLRNLYPRIFDVNSNGFVSKKEFKWMTTNERIRHTKVDILFEVNS